MLAWRNSGDKSAPFVHMSVWRSGSIGNSLNNAMIIRVSKTEPSRSAQIGFTFGTIAEIEPEHKVMSVVCVDYPKGHWSTPTIIFIPV